MSQMEDKTVQPADPGVQTQKQRWWTYGSNVALMIVLAVVLAVAVIWLGQEARGRVDMTAGNTQSLRPQTVTILKGLSSDVKIVGLAPKLKPDEARNQQAQDFYEPVADLLRRLQRASGKITIEMIDPVTEPAKLDAWVGEVQRKYGGAAKDYREFLEHFSKATLPEIKQRAMKEVEEMSKLAKNGKIELEDRNQLRTLSAVQNTVLGFPAVLGALDDSIKETLQEKVPDYKNAVDAIGSTLDGFNSQTKKLQTELQGLTSVQSAPQNLKDYAKGAAERFGQLAKIVDEAVQKKDHLGDLNLGDLRKLANRDSGEDVRPTIAVMGPGDWKMLEFSDVWTAGADDPFARGRNDAPRLRFAGEQQVVSAVLGVTNPVKKLVVFVRGGGEPLTASAGLMGGSEGPYQEFARRLRADNFEVKEKDISGQFERTQQQRPAPGQSEATDAEMRDAIWVVLSQPQAAPWGMPMPPSPELGNRLAEHLRSGGSALVMVDPNGDALESALAGWGISVKPDMVLVHETIETAEAAQSDDIVEEARRRAPIFVLNQFTDHPIVKPIGGLDLVMAMGVPVELGATADVKTSLLVPLPKQPPSWASKTTDMRTLLATGTKFNPANGDMSGDNLGFAAAADRTGKGRLVVIGSAQAAMDPLLLMTDRRFARSKVPVVRFPANGELVVNSVLWLSGHDGEKLIGISPAAMQVPRIPNISPTMLSVLRIGVMLLGLPLLAVLAGLLVWQARRD